MSDAQTKIAVSLGLLEEVVKAMLDELTPEVRTRVQEKAARHFASLAGELPDAERPNILNWLREE